MKRLVRGTGIVACAVGTLLAMATAGCCATVFYDSFEPSKSGSVWNSAHEVTVSWFNPLGQTRDPMPDQNNHIRTPGVNGIRSKDNWKNVFNEKHVLVGALDSNVYLKCWIFEDNDIPWPVECAGQGWPNGFITLVNSAWIEGNSALGDCFSIGVMGQIGYENGVLRDFFDDCCIYTTTDYYQVLNGDGVPLVPRRQGWRKYTILVNGVTGSPGDVQFLIDDKLVYNGLRNVSASTLDTIVVGARWWTHETYYYDQVEYGTIETPVNCSTISDANALPDETWVSLQSKVVTGSFNYSDLPAPPPPPKPTPPGYKLGAYDVPFPGYITIEEVDRSSALWVSSSYQSIFSSDPDRTTHLPLDRVNITGIMRTNEAGMRYLEAIEISHATDPVVQPRILGAGLKSIGSPLLDGKLVKVWGRVVSILGQERPGDWRAYFTIDDGSPGGSVKCYYNNIIEQKQLPAKPVYDPVPAVKVGDYVSVVGVPGREVLVPGTTGPEKSVWIRGAGDLRILHAAP